MGRPLSASPSWQPVNYPLQTRFVKFRAVLCGRTAIMSPFKGTGKMSPPMSQNTNHEEECRSAKGNENALWLFPVTGNDRLLN